VNESPDPSFRGDHPQEDQSTGLPVPGLRTWHGIYWFVLVAFIVYVVLLTALERIFS
jgi:hypothetical protein